MKRYLLLATCFVIITILSSACNSKSSTDATPVSTGTTTPSGIGPQGGTVSTPSGAQVVVPAGALASYVTITVEVGSSSSPTAPLDGISSMGDMVALTPHGTQFSSPVTVRVPYDPAQVPAGETPTLYKLEENGTMTALATTVDGNFLTAQITSFSYIIAGYSYTPQDYVYVLNRFSNNVLSYKIDTSGVLQGPTGTVNTGSNPVSLAVHPSFRYVYVANNSFPYTINVFNISSLTGLLSGPTGTVSTTQSDVIKVHPGGKYAFVLSSNQQTISTFSVDQGTGLLTVSSSIVQQAPLGSNSRPFYISIDPSGRYLYEGFRDYGNNTIYTYSIDQSTGALSLVGSPVYFGTRTMYGEVTVDPLINNAYVPTGNVFSVGTDGALSGPTATIPVFGRMELDQTGTKAYTLFGGSLYSYAVSTTTGLLSASTSSTVNGSVTIDGFALDPAGRSLFAKSGTSKAIVTYGINAADGTLSGPLGSVPTGTEPVVVATTQKISPAGGPGWGNGGRTGIGTYIVISTSSSNNGGGGGAVPAAAWASSTCRLEVALVGVTGGRILSSPAGIDYNGGIHGDFSMVVSKGTSVGLCVHPDPVWPSSIHYRWSGGCTPSNGPCTSAVLNTDRSCLLELY